MVAGSSLAVDTWGDHVWLQKETLNEEFLGEELLHDSGENSFGDFSADLDGVVTILENLWLDDWDESVLLANRSVSGKGMGSLLDGGLGWASVSDFEDSSPLGESASE